MSKTNIKRLGYYDFNKIDHSKAEFQKHCQDLNLGKQFDGNSDFLCVYPDKTIQDIYHKLLNNSDNRLLLRLPKVGTKKAYALKNEGDGISISYEWLSHHNLKIGIYQYSRGETLYAITQENNKATIKIHTDTNDHQVTINSSP